MAAGKTRARWHERWVSIDNSTFKWYFKGTMNSTFSIPITQLKQNAAQVIDDVVTSGQSAIIMQRSQPRVVIADFDYFNSLEAAVVDFLDAQEAEKSKKEPKISLKNYIKKRWGN